MWDHAAKWAKRNPARAGLLGLAILAPVIIIAVLLSSGARVRRAAASAEAERQHTRVHLYAADVFIAHNAVEAGNHMVALQSLDKHHPAPGQPDLRDFEWHWLRQRAQGEAARVWPAHTNRVLCLAFSPDSRRLASAGEEGRVCVWDWAEGTCRATLPMPPYFSGSPPGLMRGQFVSYFVNSVSFSPDGELLAASAGPALRLWRLGETPSLVAETNFVGGYAFFLPGQPAELMAAYRWPRITNASRVLPYSWLGRFDASLRPTAPARETTNWTFGVSADGRWLAEDNLRTIRLWNVAAGEPRSPFSTDANVHRMALSPDGSRLAVCYQQRDYFDLWDPREGRPLARLRGHAAHTVSVAFSPDGRRIASSSGDETIRFWDAATHAEVRRLPGQSAGATSLSFSPDGRWLASGGGDGAVRVWPVEAPEPVPAITNVQPPLAFSADGRWVAAAQPGGLLGVWETDTHRRAQLWTSAPPAALLFPRGEEELLAVVLPPTDAPPEAWSFSPETLRAALRFRLEMPPSRATCAAVAPDGQLCVTGHEDGSLRWWHGSTGQLLHESRPYTEAPAWMRGMSNGLAVDGVSFSPDGRYLTSWTSFPRLLESWSVATRSVLATNVFPGRNIFSFAFAPDGETCATGGAGMGIRLWHTATLEPVGTLPAQRSNVDQLAWSPRGGTLATSSYDGKLRLWHVATGRMLLTLRESNLETRSYSGLIFSPDGQWFAACDARGAMVLWHAPSLEQFDRGE